MPRFVRVIRNRPNKKEHPEVVDPADKKISQGVLILIAGAIATIIGLVMIIFAASKDSKNTTQLVFGPIILVAGLVAICLGVVFYVSGRRQKSEKIESHDHQGNVNSKSEITVKTISELHSHEDNHNDSSKPNVNNVDME